MKRKKVLFTEVAYLLGIFFIALGTAFMEKSDFGVSMVVAPAYVIHLKVSQYWSFFTFGMAEYTLQALLIIIMTLSIRKFKVTYLFSFVTAVFYGFVLDGCMYLISLMSSDEIWLRVLCYIVGLIFCAIGVSMMFHTYISPEAYELVVKECSAKFGCNINKFKTCYDIVSCLIAVILSFCFFGMWHFEGVKWGTVLCALINGATIGFCSKFFEKHFEFKDGLKLRSFFSK